MVTKKQAVKTKPPIAKDERAWVKENNGAPCDEEELTERATDLEGSLGDAARALLAAREKFEAELQRVGYEHG